MPSLIRVLLAGLLVTGCAGQVIRSTDLPARPDLPPLGPVRVVLSSAPPVMTDEVRELQGAATRWREVGLPSNAVLATACETPTGIVLRPSIQRVHFASNVDDRNTLL